MNGFTFYMMAPTVLGWLGIRSFFALYLGGGLMSSWASVWFNNTLRPKENFSAHGASGAIYSIVSFFACVAPKAEFALFAVIPMPAWFLVTAVFLFDGYSAMNNWQPGTDTAGHVAGILAGVGYYVGKRFRLL